MNVIVRLSAVRNVAHARYAGKGRRDDDEVVNSLASFDRPCLTRYTHVARRAHRVDGNAGNGAGHLPKRILCVPGRSRAPFTNHQGCARNHRVQDSDARWSRRALPRWSLRKDPLQLVPAPVLPRSRFIRVEQWLEVQRARFLDCGHHHVVFTIPEELNTLWRHNRREMTDVLFAAASETLLELLGDPKHLGAKPGIIAALHTWGQALQLHPHLHRVVTAGGLDANGDWRDAKKRILLPGRVARDLFQGRFLGKLSRLLRARRLLLPEDLDEDGALCSSTRFGGSGGMCT